MATTGLKLAESRLGCLPYNFPYRFMVHIGGFCHRKGETRTQSRRRLSLPLGVLLYMVEPEGVLTWVVTVSMGFLTYVSIYTEASTGFDGYLLRGAG
jgi:hypothetical protein